MLPAQLSEIQDKFDDYNCDSDEESRLVTLGGLAEDVIPDLLAHISELTGKVGELEAAVKKVIQAKHNDLDYSCGEWNYVIPETLVDELAALVGDENERT